MCRGMRSLPIEFCHFIWRSIEKCPWLHKQMFRLLLPSNVRENNSHFFKREDERSTTVCRNFNKSTHFQHEWQYNYALALPMGNFLNAMMKLSFKHIFVFLHLTRSLWNAMFKYLVSITCSSICKCKYFSFLDLQRIPVNVKQSDKSADWNRKIQFSSPKYSDDWIVCLQNIN